MRPTKYSKKVQEKADWYVNGGYTECGDAVPSQAGLASELEITRQTLFNWKETHKKFFDTLEKISINQERITLTGGLTGQMNSTIVKLLLANHGYGDKKQLEYTTHGEPFNRKWTVEFINSDFANE